MYSNNTIPPADVPLPKPDMVHAKHPFRNKDTHQTLLDYLRPRLMQGAKVRDSRLERMARIDRNVAGWMAMSDDDRKRKHKEDSTGIPQAIDINLPLTYVQLDDMMTYYAQTFSPNRGMFYQMGKPDETQPASQIVTIMNNHAVYAGYFRPTLQSIFSILKYNIGGFQGHWSRDQGPKLSKNSAGQDVLSMETVWQGNRLDTLDMYNTFWDPSVNPTQVYKDAEWAADAKMVSRHWLQTKAAHGLYFNLEDAIKEDSGVSECIYYRSPADRAKLSESSPGADTNWVAIMSEAPDYASDSGFELVSMTIKLNPFQLNLIPRTRENANRNRLEIWKIGILNDKWIIDATYMNNVHGYLPYFIGMMNDDGMGLSQKSPGEIIQPLQNFASFLMNTHVRATRKNIWGLTVYDQSVVDLNQIPEGEVSARIPVKPAGYGKDLRQAIWQQDKVLDTKQTMQDLESVMGIINQFFPTTSMPSQIASIERAVDSQVAAVQQGANRRMQKGARLLDETLFRPMRFAFYYNIIQYQPDDAEIGNFYGKPIKVNLEELRATDLPFIIGQGLKAIDRMAAASQLQTIIFAFIQNPLTAQQVDLMAMLDYWTSMIDVDVDMTQFRLQQPGAGPVPAGPGDPNAAAAAPTQQVPPQAAGAAPV